ncbi:taste receptor type 2 member 143-like [Protopterus annectens]|uniref:taste receptor type 2 member 143-like n=1 Tax=Protopterus annectens TaxID=7888 RepID=UPI001CFC463A|nr:taste receptor type 2 member 143-like [Protopterus annectens]
MTTALVISMTLMAFLGLPGNIFIISTAIHDYHKSGDFPPKNLILISVAASNIFFQSALYVMCLVMVLGTFCYTMKYSIFFTQFTACMNTWLTAWLCVFYWVKITNSSTWFVTSLKHHIVQIVPFILLLTVAGSGILSSIILFNETPFDQANQTMILSMGNCTINNRLFQFMMSCFVVYVVITCVVPFALMVSSSFLIILTLCQHASRMKTSLDGISSSRFDVHVRVAKMIVSLIFSYIGFLVFIFLSIFHQELAQESSFYIFAFFLLDYPTVSSFLIIYGSPRLWKSCAVACHTKRRTSE